MNHFSLQAKPLKNVALQRQRGFTMFEMIVYILAASILFAAAFDRYREFPGEAERANFQAIMAQLNTAINLQMMRVIVSENYGQPDELLGGNPMDLMLTPPGNYVGAFAGVDLANMPRRVWYFDETTRELVYLADNAENLYRVDTSQPTQTEMLRFQVDNVYARNGSGRWEGLILRPTFEYRWAAIPLEIPQEQMVPAPPAP
jgi:type II secretory pathway pseudopilin PulG